MLGHTHFNGIFKPCEAHNAQQQYLSKSYLFDPLISLSKESVRKEVPPGTLRKTLTKSKTKPDTRYVSSVSDKTR